MNLIKKYLNKKRKTEITTALKTTKANLQGVDNTESRLMIEKVIGRINDSTVYVSKSQHRKLMEVNASINQRDNNPKSIIRKECDNMIKIINKTYVEPTGRESGMNDLDNKIELIYCKLTENNERILELRNAQTEVLGKDKNLWKKYQSEINRRTAENRVFEQSYDTLLKKKENLGIVNEVEKTKVLNDLLESKDLYIDIDESSEMIKNNEMYSNDVNAENEKLQDTIFASTGSNTLDDEYNSALEAAARRNLEIVSGKTAVEEKAALSENK